jgi:pimeloyl-ACP methyl ester carboxylesterase
MPPALKRVQTSVLEIACEDSGPADGIPVLLMHGWPCDPRYFHTERGRAGLAANRREFCRLIWRLWSPNWVFDDATFERTATSFDNPDFVDVTIQSYRHRFKYAAGDPDLEPIEQRLTARPTIAAPTIALHGEFNGVGPPEMSANHARFFTGAYQRRVIPRAGHNLPQEVPGDVTEATLELIRATS